MAEFSSEHALECLAIMGLRTELIEEAPDERRADLRAWWQDEEYLVEAKERTPHRDWLKLQLEAGTSFQPPISRSIEPWHVLGEVVQKAYSQLTSTPAGNNAFRCLWVVAAHGDEAFVTACIEKCLLGTRVLSARSEPDDPPRLVDCYYHAESSFEKCPLLDCAVLSRSTGMSLLVNSYSPNIARFRESFLYRQFAMRQAAVDPELEVAGGSALMIGRDFNGARNGRQQWEYVRDKYSLLTSVGLDSQWDALLTIELKKRAE